MKAELPAELSQGAILRDKEYAWELSAFPAALRIAPSLGYACLGGQIWFVLRDDSLYEPFWLEANAGTEVLMRTGLSMLGIRAQRFLQPSTLWSIGQSSSKRQKVSFSSVILSRVVQRVFLHRVGAFQFGAEEPEGSESPQRLTIIRGGGRRRGRGVRRGRLG
jgi:hypothetical protein